MIATITATVRLPQGATEVELAQATRAALARVGAELIACNYAPDTDTVSALLGAGLAGEPVTLVDLNPAH